MTPDRPQLLRDPNEVLQREMEIDLPHVAPLNNWVRSLRSRLGRDAIVPWFDPRDGGCEAQILLALEAPGRKQRVNGVAAALSHATTTIFLRRIPGKQERKAASLGIW